MSTAMQLLIVPLLAIGAPNGASAAHRPADSTAARDSSRMTLVEVQNDQRTPVTVFAQNAFGEVKLGVVSPDDIANLRVPEWLVSFDSDIDFFVQPKHGLEQESGTINVRRGDNVGLIVPAK